MKKQRIMLLLEITLFIMIVGTIVSYAAGSNPPSDGVKYNSTTVKAALDDLYEKVGSAGCNSWTTRNPDTSQIVVGGSRTYYSGIYPSNFTVSCANKTCPTCESQGYKKTYVGKRIKPTKLYVANKDYQEMNLQKDKQNKFAYMDIEFNLGINLKAKANSTDTTIFVKLYGGEEDADAGFGYQSAGVAIGDHWHYMTKITFDYSCEASKNGIIHCSSSYVDSLTNSSDTDGATFSLYLTDNGIKCSFSSRAFNSNGNYTKNGVSWYGANVYADITVVYK